ncbi:MAG: ABC transporter ATP-binding protein [Christensenellaceae bacterium]|jgi:NitT/TauT family transport system ATP-binding protein|nr:ABC transporter ATP-binding protein [Christensenellaceae bacterium]
MIEFKNVCFSYNSEVVVSDFSMSFDTKKIHCILGPSGCGKTTILNLLAGLIKPQSGEIFGVSNIVSYGFQEERLIPQLTCLANLDFALSHAYPVRSKRIEVCHEFLGFVGLKDSYKKYPHEMSGGMRQRLTLARCFAYPSDLLLLDEPFKALDIVLKLELLDLFVSLWTKDMRTTFFISHDPDEAAFTADIAYVCDGKPFVIKDKIEILKARSTKTHDYSKFIYQSLISKK